MGIRTKGSMRVVKRRPWMTRFQILAGMTSLAIGAQRTYAQPSPAGDPSPNMNSPASADAPLAGPTVNSGATKTSERESTATVASVVKSDRPTLIHYNFDGTVADVGPAPDRKAVELLTLTPEQRKEFDRITTGRNVMFNTLLAQNLRQLYELQQYDPANETEAYVKAIRSVTEAFKPYFDRGSFVDEISPYLTFRQRVEARRILMEYTRARVADLKKASGGKKNAFQIAIQMRLENLGAMAKTSLEAQGQMAEADFQRFVDELDLTPEQAEKIRAILGPIYVQKALGNSPPKTDQLLAFIQVSDVLESDQKLKLHHLFVEQVKEDAAGEQQRPGIAMPGL